MAAGTTSFGWAGGGHIFRTRARPGYTGPGPYSGPWESSGLMGSNGRAYSHLADEELVAFLVRGDPAALEELYDRHGRAVYSLALRMLGDSEAAEDVTQDTFLKLWRQPSSYSSDRGRLLPWLLGVAHHRAVDLLRRRRVELKYRQGLGSTDTRPTPDGEDPTVRAWQSLQAEIVVSALQDLPPDQRTVIEMAYYQGLTQSEIAQRLGQPLGTVKTRMRLAIQKLRAAVARAQQ